MEHDLHLLMEEVLEFIVDIQRTRHYPRQIGGRTTKVSVTRWVIDGVEIVRTRHSFQTGPGRKNSGSYRDEWQWGTKDRLHVEFDSLTSNITLLLLAVGAGREAYAIVFDVSRNRVAVTDAQSRNGSVPVPAVRRAVQPLLGSA